jgi:hypothetical protein
MRHKTTRLNTLREAGACTVNSKAEAKKKKNRDNGKKTIETRRSAARLRRLGVKERGSKVEACRERVRYGEVK